MSWPLEIVVAEESHVPELYQILIVQSDFHPKLGRTCKILCATKLCNVFAIDANEIPNSGGFLNPMCVPGKVSVTALQMESWMETLQRLGSMSIESTLTFRGDTRRLVLLHTRVPDVLTHPVV